MDQLFLFTLDHPTITGIMIGGGFIGGPLAAIGWCLGYEHAMRKFTRWTRREVKAEPVHIQGNVVNLPALPSGSIERRAFPTTPGRRV
ncbi:hypothetical protein [Bradyrhizobium sp. CCBAU 51753]|uniref:hypothetical protein n=1 Tax=Bradyrhizobium sp. CCBAU 51753 TaxID=1325100 RepID=UPI00188C39C0|nr:hypothetical protein [Bradyrhizobium sp. CCBAU 51753]